MNIGKKIKAIRIAEGLSQSQMAQVIDTPVGSLRDWEQCRRSPSGESLINIGGNEMFEKYSYWLMTGKTLPESGQIAPDFSILLELGIVESDTEGKKTA